MSNVVMAASCGEWDKNEGATVNVRALRVNTPRTAVCDARNA